MADRYNDHAIVITDETVSVRGKTRLMKDFMRAEPYQVTNWLRAGLIFLFGCILPILAMILFVQLGAIPVLYSWFGPVLTILSIGLGVVAGLIGIYWPKPWAVVVEEATGFKTLTLAPSRDEAAKISDAINGIVEPEAVGNYEV